MRAFKNNITSFFNATLPWLLLVAVAALCWFLASTIWLIIASPKVASLPPVSLNAQAPKSSFNGDIFSVFKTPEPVKPETKPVTNNSNFTLEGVMVASPESRSSAILSANGESKRYVMGQKIADSDYRLVDVSWKKAVLEDSAGNQIEIDLYKKFDFNAGASQYNNSNKQDLSSYTSQAAPTLPSPLNNYQATPAPEQRKNNPPDLKTQVNNMLDKAVNELQSNPAGYLNKMGVMATGDGYEVTSSMNSTIRSNIGLQAGDKVISVNGQSIGQPQQDAQLLRQIQQTGSAEIQIQRGSQVITVRQQF